MPAEIHRFAFFVIVLTFVSNLPNAGATSPFPTSTFFPPEAALPPLVFPNFPAPAALPPLVTPNFPADAALPAPVTPIFPIDASLPPLVVPNFPAPAELPPLVFPDFPAEASLPPLVTPNFPADATLPPLVVPNLPDGLELLPPAVVNFPADATLPPFEIPNFPADAVLPDAVLDFPELADSPALPDLASPTVPDLPPTVTVPEPLPSQSPVTISEPALSELSEPATTPAPVLQDSPATVVAPEPVDSAETVMTELPTAPTALPENIIPETPTPLTVPENSVMSELTTLPEAATPELVTPVASPLPTDDSDGLAGIQNSASQPIEPAFDSGLASSRIRPPVTEPIAPELPDQANSDLVETATVLPEPLIPEPVLPNLPESTTAAELDAPDSAAPDSAASMILDSPAVTTLPPPTEENLGLVGVQNSDVSQQDSTGTFDDQALDILSDSGLASSRILIDSESELPSDAIAGVRFDEPTDQTVLVAENPNDLITVGSVDLEFDSTNLGLANNFVTGLESEDSTIVLAAISSPPSPQLSNLSSSDSGQSFLADVSFSTTAVPEPGTCVFCTLLMGSLLLRRRR